MALKAYTLGHNRSFRPVHYPLSLHVSFVCFVTYVVENTLGIRIRAQGPATSELRKSSMRSFLVALLIAGSTCAWAQQTTQALSQCLAETTTGKDRKDLARWVFFAMASHPDIKQYTANSAEAAATEAHKTMADLFTRLLAESCNRQTQAAFKEGGAKAIEIAFQTLGQLAMQELMANPEVTSSMSKFEKNLDQNKLNKVFGGG